ncbi:chemotaxis protein [Clostridium sporogenes]|jgi:two-component system chemotaxis response regulator CheV|uniref:Stage 0 sporulation protein A homolog n=4 Tax=Clostridium TaxID=1485 RepID=A0A7X5P843_CLOSG|nr:MULTISPECIES: chemotaxis protein [Clostridium]AJD31579.1 response regulator [Clostridium botulinum Prevot_594]AVP61516.1 chemotaxis protein CheV [Clostridium botulinum]AKC62489.1 chemotaxis protein CheV [Clostridium sporogenes]AKJ89752.1 chemotaxis protein CheV [Clostridium sporogenes]AVP64968.1 chemotaxis protein CheV [Clostridium botulinum]
METNILLESGTGEVEIIEFLVNNKHYAINVIKVKEVIEVDNVTKVPQSDPAIEGLILCREKIFPLIDLSYILGQKSTSKKKFKTIICEFNRVSVAFKIDEIVAVHRIGWDKILKPDDIAANPLVIGNILLKDKIILLLDFEKIVTDINPSTGISEERIVNVDYKDRSHIKVFLADDSSLIRKLLKDTLTKAGFKKLTIFDDGKQALDKLLELVEKKGEDFTEDVQILITDIEMPQMDGHTLTRKVKEHPILKRLPVIIFSSLITNDLKHKGTSVGADAQLSKPDIGELVSIIDNYIE